MIKNQVLSNKGQEVVESYDRPGFGGIRLIKESYHKLNTYLEITELAICNDLFP